VIQDGGVSVPPGQSPASANPVTSQAPTPTPLGTVASAPIDSSDSTPSVIIAVIAGLAIVAVVAWFLFGRGRRS
jgi:hypothetical protein